jgi:predicted nucleotidyltransferase
LTKLLVKDKLRGVTDHSSHLLEHILGAKSKVAVLRVLFNSKIGFSGNTIAKRAGMGLLAIQNALADLERLGLVEVERGAVEHRYRLNTKHYLVTHGLRALYEAERSMVKALVRELRPMLDGHVVTAGLFGSFARGRAAAGSDIDLLVVVETLKERDEVSALLAEKAQEFAERYGLPLQPVIYERRRLNNDGGVYELIETAERDWVAIAGADLKQLRKTLRKPKAASRRSA